MSRAESPAPPYRGSLVNLLAQESDRGALVAEAATLPAIQISAESAAWLRMLATGALSPVDRFLNRADCESVSNSLRLADGALFPWPLTLPVRSDAGLREGARVALRDSRNNLLAVLAIEELFEFANAGQPLHFAVSGPLQVLTLPQALLMPQLHRSPAEVRRILGQANCKWVIEADHWDFNDTQFMVAMTKIAEENDATLLLNLIAAEERVDDFDLYMKLRACERSADAFGKQAVLNVVDLPDLPRGARRLLLNAIVHKNYGANAYICDLADADSNSYDISETTLRSYLAEIGIEPVSLKPSQPAASPRPAAMRRPPSSGFCIWLTGLPGAGKSTLAERLTIRLMERGRMVTLLDGDVVRTHLSRGLSFSREDRDTNVQRIGFVAAEIVRHGGVVICAAVSPYRSAREKVRRMMPPGAFVEVFVDTPANICEQRDVKGFYARARSGQLKSFTGVDDPYEKPENPEVRVSASEETPEQSERQVLDYFLQRHFFTAGAEQQA
ncbi:MAG TPA: adenylyl-sulfate kinase [Silvibacterium sp.]|nr:adenylyl-sulfate kinase [Silvibacterium sp.]